MFNPMSVSRFVDDHRLCCNFDNLETCTTLEPQPPLFSCGSLMQNSVLRIAMWVLGGSALVGNAFVVIMRLQGTTRNVIAYKQSLFIGNLGVSDFFMGVYMIMIASVDVYYSNEYYLYSEEWRSGLMCKVASFLALLSSEASVFFITLISIDRFISVTFPFSKVQLRAKSSKWAVFG